MTPADGPDVPAGPAGPAGPIGPDGRIRSHKVCAASTAANPSAIQAEPSEPVMGEAVCLTWTPTNPQIAASA